MANDCFFEMKIKGSKNAIDRVIKCLNGEYNYLEKKPSHKHFFRIFDLYDESELKINDDGTYTKHVYGYCAWSVSCCMLSTDDDEYSYYHSCKEEYKDNFMGTNLWEQSQDCEIEVFSEEIGMEFSEHYLFKNGKMLICDEVKIEQCYEDDNGNIITDIDWDTFDGDLLVDNPNRVSLEGEFDFIL